MDGIEVSPSSEKSSFSPTKTYYIKSSSGDFSDELRVLDLSSSIADLDYAGSLTDPFCKRLKEVAKVKQADASAWAFEMKRKTLSSVMQIHDAKDSGSLAAELDMPMLKHFGGWKMSFPEGSQHSGHTIETRPVSFFKKDETFMKDSVTYVWDVSFGGGRGRLFKVTAGGEKQVMVAESLAKSWFENSCVLMVDATLLDEVVALGACVAVLNR